MTSMTGHGDHLVENIPPPSENQSDVAIGISDEHGGNTPTTTRAIQGLVAELSVAAHALTASNMIAPFDTDQKLVARSSGSIDLESIDNGVNLKTSGPSAEPCQEVSKQPSANG
ncbi:hypothetical protein BGZ65_004871 [Modicella reniformis]|uniref:Uncharacterized protein n=1 Tax=Modicella reniformis TaxID=1440133 RepID=A0A9P6SVB9_9FUNG|nr:hypothetical protein BGZ65_004871 [Modicella reniformis]